MTEPGRAEEVRALADVLEGLTSTVEEEQRAIAALRQFAYLLDRQEAACWATVLVDRETMCPKEASAGELEELSDLGIAVDRCWITPGPLDRQEARCAPLVEFAARMRRYDRVPLWIRQEADNALRAFREGNDA